MDFIIKRTTLSPELKSYIYNEFSKHSVNVIGFDGLLEEPISFKLEEQNEFIGCIVVQMFWGQLHIKYLIIAENWRGRGYASLLMEHALKYAKDRHCNFAFVETMSFQAPKFYQKLGFKIELKRDGYAGKTSYHYLKKDL